MKNLCLLLRPHQWIKNSFVFLPLFFGRHILDILYIIPCIVVFFSFCFAASGIYCLNDICDVEEDKKHPKKSKRPIASGTISSTMGYMIMLACFVISVALISLGGLFYIGEVQSRLVTLICSYIIINIGYCFYLKQKAIIDVFVVAIGFVFRVLAGGLATGIWLSHWIILMTFLLSLFLAFAKRRDDVLKYEEAGVVLRKNIQHYNIPFLNSAIGIVASITMVCYIMYTVSPDVTERFNSDSIYITSIFVLAGIIRYLQITIVSEKSGSPTRVLLSDRFIQICLLGWILTFAIILYI